MKHYVGIDNSSQPHMVYICDENEVKVKSFVVVNDFQGFEEPHDAIRNYPDHKIGFELPHGPIVDYLRDKGEEEIYSINPLKVKRFKETVNVSGDKSDPVDARAIAVYLKKNEAVLRRMRFNSKEVEELNVLRISHDRLTRENARYSNKLRFIVRQYFPLFVALFTEIACKTGLELLLEYYDAQKEKNKTHSVTVRALSNKWIKVIFAMWKHGKKYDDEVCLKKKQKKEKVA